MKTWADYRIEIPAGRGGEIDVTCPECSPSRKKKQARCLSVNVEKGVWLCNHCGWSGTLGEGGRKSDDLHWRKPMYRRPDPAAETELPSVTFEWFRSRGIGREVVIRNKIQRRKVYMPQLEEEVTAIAFPYFRDCDLVNVKYRDAQKNFRMEAGAERILYGLNDIAETTVICEGEIDKLSIETAGIRHCVSVPDGAPTQNTKNYASKFTFLDDERLAQVKVWIIAVDNDAPGVRLEEELCRRFGIENCMRVTWPEGCKDANDVLVKHDAETLNACLAQAEPYPISGVIEVMDLARELDELYQSGLTRGLSTGWKSLDDYYTVRAGELNVITGVPNSGKSNWVDALTVNLAKLHGWRFAVFSPENQPLQNHMSRLMEHYAETPFRDGPTPRMSLSDMHICRDWVHHHFRFILPEDEAEWNVDFVLTRTEALVRRFGINGIVIDPWNEMEHQRPSGMTETEYVSACLKKIRQFARRNRVGIFLVAHPQKMYRNKDGDYPVPSLYDISGSAHFRNKADNGLVIYRDINDPEKHSVEIHVQKVRFREVGRVGGIELKYLPATGGYADLPKPKLVYQRGRHEDELQQHWADN